MNKIVLTGCMLALSAVLAGCAGTAAAEEAAEDAAPEAAAEVAEAPAPEGVVADMAWPSVKADYEALAPQAADLASTIGGAGMTVRDQVYAIIEDAIANIPAAMAAFETGVVDDSAKAALETIYIDGLALDGLGNDDTVDAGLYIHDLGHDCLWLVANVYNGMYRNADVSQAEMKENFDKVKSFDEEQTHDAVPQENETAEQHWNAFAERINAA